MPFSFKKTVWFSGSKTNVAVIDQFNRFAGQLQDRGGRLTSVSKFQRLLIYGTISDIESALGEFRNPDGAGNQTQKLPDLTLTGCNSRLRIYLVGLAGFGKSGKQFFDPLNFGNGSIQAIFGKINSGYHAEFKRLPMSFKTRL